MLPIPAFFRVLFVVTRMAEAYQVIIFPHKLRVLVRMLDVVYLCCLYRPAISLAVLTFVTIPAQDCSTLVLPPRRCVIKWCHSSTSRLYIISAVRRRSASGCLWRYPLPTSPHAGGGRAETKSRPSGRLETGLPGGFSSRHHGLLSIYHGLTGHTGHYRFFSKNLLTRFRAASSKCGDPYMRFATCRQVSPSTYRSTIIRRTLISRTEDIYSSTSASCS